MTFREEAGSSSDVHFPFLFSSASVFAFVHIYISTSRSSSLSLLGCSFLPVSSTVQSSSSLSSIFLSLSPSLFFDFPPSLLYPFIFFSIQSRKAPTRTYTPGRKGFSHPYPNDVNPTRKCLLVVTSSRKVTGAPLSFWGYGTTCYFLFSLLLYYLYYHIYLFIYLYNVFCESFV